ncbi:hypothetical protein TRAPUB_7596 [Trametes pubescens]|uniref:Uncharacterized protein n=1 Tax=Trametes pubescens TaxID=154538 RepID=A0A1M2V2Y7_TRAPU|nr:hypothetical protein TRAPUB_7596 [Trametes pubescens]
MSSLGNGIVYWPYPTDYFWRPEGVCNNTQTAWSVTKRDANELIGTAHQFNGFNGSTCTVVRALRIAGP